MVFEHLKNKKIEVYFDEWQLRKQFKIKIINFFENTQEVNQDKKNKKGDYYIFEARLYQGNPFGITKDASIKLHISKSCFDREIIRHFDFSKESAIPLNFIFDIKKTSKKKIQISNFQIEA